MSVVGLLLAGGRSSRFGAEKAMTPWADGVLMDAPLAALAGVCARVAVSAAPGSGAASHATALGLTRLEDDPSDAEGPLAGIRRGLVWAAGQGATRLAIAPCDAPTVTADHYRILLGAAGTGAVACSIRGLEPLVSIWPVAAGLEAVEAALRSGDHPPIRAVLSAIQAVEVMLTDYDGLNVNQPGDLAG